MANYLYNGIELPAIPTVENEYQAIYIKNDIYYFASKGSAHVFTQNNGEYIGVLLNKAHKAYYDVYKLIGGVWTSVDTANEADVPKGFFTPVWSNHDIPAYGFPTLIIFKASDPPVLVEPVCTIDPTALLMGYRVGKSLRQQNEG
jgi:hypothetical protein